MLAPTIAEFSDWLATPLGQYLTRCERLWLEHTVSNIFGFVAVQLDVPELDALAFNRMPHRWRLGWRGEVRCEDEQLPLASQSVDLLVLPHGFDFSEDPHQLLREAERVLVPDGQLVITGFNPLSLWGMRRLWSNKHSMPWQARFLGLNRVKDWLELMNFEPRSSAMLAYAPPLQHTQWRSRCQFMEAAGDRWWPICGAVYGLRAIKRVAGMRIIRPQWHQKPLGSRLIAIGDRRSPKTRDPQ
jgi:SAM-dependent methyltransferase